MADNDGLTIFGFQIKRLSREKEDKLQSIVPPVDEDGAGYVTAAGAHYGTYVDIDGKDGAKDDHQLIRQYRATAIHPEVDAAIEDIVAESIGTNDAKQPVTLILDAVDAPENIKKQIIEEFDNIVGMLNFNDLGHDIYKRWYVDGRMYHHLVVDNNNLKRGIQEIRPIDAAKIKKMKRIERKKDPVTGAAIIKNVEEFFVYQERPGTTSQGVKISPDAISYVTSGLLDEQRKKVVSHLHKALKPVNQLRMMEDSLVIYRLARAPERRIFYVDVGNLPRGKSDEYLKSIMARYRNKLVYDANTGQIRDDRKHMSMLEDFWIPRREGRTATEVSSLPGGENLGQIEDIIYFQKRLYKALNVPINRLEQESQFSLGRSTEITRDELKFQKFIDRLRSRFNHLFYNILKKQLILKGIITEEDWDEWKNDIVVDYVRDNHFTELRNAEMLRERLQTADMAQQYVGTYFSKEWVWKNIFHMDDDEIKEIKKQMKSEMEDGEIADPMAMDQQNQVPEDGNVVEEPPVPQEIPAPGPEEDEENKTLNAPRKKQNEQLIQKELELIENISKYLSN